MQLAWAAGFFDGEGTTLVHTDASRPGYFRLEVKVPQHGVGAVPQVLFRFQAAVLGMGKIDRPKADGTYMWRSCGYEEAQAVIALLWRLLGPVKRAQAASAMQVVRAQYEARRYEARPSRRRGVPHVGHQIDPPTPVAAADLERAWAAGFLDAEGCFGLARSRPRKDGSDWYRIRASASQNGVTGIPAEVLYRLRGALGGVGRIECHGEPDDFRWCLEDADGVESVVELVNPWLGEAKRAQARAALANFRAQLRVRGTSERCIRGHAYDRMRIWGGRTRRKCNACARIVQRRKRAAMGIPPRQFKDPKRRYAF